MRKILEYFKRKIAPRRLRCVVCGAPLLRVYRNPVDCLRLPYCGYHVDYFHQERMKLTYEQYVEKFGPRDLVEDLK
jgi:hypothetical protein